MKYFVEVGGGFVCNDKTPKNLKEAFEKSIEKWEIIAGGGKIIDLETFSCGLCNLYIKQDCEGCPIFRETGLSQCFGFSEFMNEKRGVPSTALPVLNKLKEWQRKYVPETKLRILESSILFYPRKDTNQVTVQFIHNGDIHSEKFDGDIVTVLEEVLEMAKKEETADYIVESVKACFAEPTGKESK